VYHESTNHDPYLNTVQRALREKEYRSKPDQSPNRERIKPKNTLKRFSPFNGFDLHGLFSILPDGHGNILF